MLLSNFFYKNLLARAATVSRSAYKKYIRAINVVGTESLSTFSNYLPENILSVTYVGNSFITVKILRFSPLQINLAFNRKDKNSVARKGLDCHKSI